MSRGCGAKQQIGMGSGQGKGFGGGGNRGRMCFCGNAGPGKTLDPKEEKLALKNQAGVLQSELDLIKKRLTEIETETEVK
jgi:hypothetical protein